MMKQKDAVFAAITAAQEQGLEGDAARNFAVEQVKQGLMDGTIQHSAGQITDEKRAQGYARSLVSNWLKKDERLNGGTKYVPATKRGPILKDETLRKIVEARKSLEVNLNALRTSGGDPDLIARVEAALEQTRTKEAERREALAAEKAQSKVQSLEETMANLEALGIEVA